MDFNELLKPAGQPNDEAVMERIKQSGLPVVLYGASVDVADAIIKKLSDNGITLHTVVYDDESPVQITLTRTLNNMELVAVSAIDRQLPAYHVILGFVRAYGRIVEVKAKFNNAQSVAYLSEIFDMEEVRPSFIQENREYLKNFYDNLLDRRSKDSLVAYLLSKIRQDMQYLPPVFDKFQYFPKDIISLSDRESYFDCGAFTGDTVADFLKASGGVYNRIWAAEPDGTNYQRLIQYIENEKLPDIEAINKGIYSYSGRLPFQEEGTMLSMIKEKADRFIEVDTIDRITAGRPVTYIKLDVEGAELEALRGAVQTIRNYKPVLGISIYHKESDLIAIPLYLKEIAPEYQFYFRAHKKLAIDAVLYGIVKHY